MHHTRSRLWPLAFPAAAALLLTSCSSGGGSDDESGTTQLDFWLWDSNQQAGYQECVDAFEQENNDIDVTITQYGYGDYWTALTAGLVADEAPDVFVNHLNYYPELSSKNQLLPLDDAVSDAGLNMSIYREGLADLWVGQDGARYGIPLDYDTVAVFANSAMLSDAGISKDELDAAAWNPDDGGTWEQIIAHLTVDTNGVRGDEEGFDKDSIAVYGLGLNSSGGGFGQTEWSMYAFSNDWEHSDTNPWGTSFNYGDDNFVDTIAWYQSLVEKGYMPSLQIASSGIGQVDAFGAGKYALVTEGSWNTKSYFSLDGVDVTIAPVPEGPNGERASMFNGLAASVASTTHHQEAAEKFALFLGSQDCQDLTAAQGVAFPAVEASADISTAAFNDAGIDVSPFLVPIEEGSTHLAPVADNWTELQNIMNATMDAIMSLEADPSELVEANEKVNALYQ